MIELCVFICKLGDIAMSNGLKFAEHSNFSENKLQFTLSSTSTGGPATTVTWTRNSVVITSGQEQESQTVLNNTETAEYIHTLTVTVEYLHTVNMGERLGGVYTCTVSNRKPSNDSSNLIVQGKLSWCTLLYFYLKFSSCISSK